MDEQLRWQVEHSPGFYMLNHRHRPQTGRLRRGGGIGEGQTRTAPRAHFAIEPCALRVAIPKHRIYKSYQYNVYKRLYWRFETEKYGLKRRQEGITFSRDRAFGSPKLMPCQWRIHHLLEFDGLVQADELVVTAQSNVDQKRSVNFRGKSNDLAFKP